MSGSFVRSDISEYIASMVDQSLENEDLVVEDQLLINEIKKSLIAHADGM